MRTKIDQLETRKGLKPTVEKCEREFSRCYYSVERSCLKFLNSENQIKMDQIFKKMEIQKKQPSLDSSSDEIEKLPSTLNLKAVTKETRSIKAKTTISLTSAFTGEIIPPVDPNNVCMSTVPRGYKIVSKMTSVPELFDLQFIKFNYVFDPQLSAIRDLIKTKDPKTHKKISAMNR